MTREGDNRYRIELVEKTFALLEAFRPDRRELTVREMVEATGQTQSSVYRIVANLARLGILDLDPATRRYRIGSKLYALGSLAVLDVRKLAMPQMELLRDRCCLTVSLSAAHDRSGGILVEVLESREPYGVALAVGTREPLHCTASGKCELAHARRGQGEDPLAGLELTAFTANTLTDRDALEAELAEVRRLGYAMDRGEWAEHVNCVAVPVFDRTGELCGALSVSAPAGSTGGSLREAIPALLEAGARVSRDLGFAGPYPPGAATATGDDSPVAA